MRCELLEQRLLSGGEFAKSVLVNPVRSVVVGFLNPYSYKVIAQDRSIIDGTDFWFSDGALLCFLSNLRRQRKISRASFDFSSIAGDVFGFAQKCSKRVALIGGTKADIEEATLNIRSLYRGLNIVCSLDGYFPPEESQVVMERIRQSKPDILIVGLGTPLQEEFAIMCKEFIFGPCIIFTCGGFLTQSAIKPDFYHPIVKASGLRWLQRAVLFRHVRRRLVRDYPLFIAEYLWGLFRDERKSSGEGPPATPSS